MNGFILSSGNILFYFFGRLKKLKNEQVLVLLSSNIVILTHVTHDLKHECINKELAKETTSCKLLKINFSCVT